MPRVITVITAAGPGAAAHIGETGQSVVSQALPAGWDFEWLVRVDGDSTDDVTDARRNLLPDTRISIGANRRGGPAMARNMALARATGELVKTLDADDLLTPGALARDIDVLSNSVGIEWATSRVLDLLPDGSTEGFDGSPAPGYIRCGEVLRYWASHDFRASVHPATLCMRRSLLEMLGGWMALPASEDTGLLLALSAVSAGHFCGEVGLLYRKWPGQMTAQAAHVDPVERRARMDLIGRRARRLLESPNPIRDAVLESSDSC